MSNPFQVVRTGRVLVIGVGDSSTGVTEDLFDVKNGEPDLAQLRAILGVGSRP
jgi:hypothetical protein